MTSSTRTKRRLTRGRRHAGGLAMCCCAAAGLAFGTAGLALGTAALALGAATAHADGPSHESAGASSDPAAVYPELPTYQAELLIALDDPSLRVREEASAKLLDEMRISEADLVAMRDATDRPEPLARLDRAMFARFADGPRSAIGISWEVGSGRVSVLHDGFPSGRPGGLEVGDIIVEMAGEPTIASAGLLEDIRAMGTQQRDPAGQVDLPRIDQAGVRRLTWSHLPGETVDIAVLRERPAAPQNPDGDENDAVANGGERGGNDAGMGERAGRINRGRLSLRDFELVELTIELGTWDNFGPQTRAQSVIDPDELHPSFRLRQARLGVRQANRRAAEIVWPGSRPQTDLGPWELLSALVARPSATPPLDERDTQFDTGRMGDGGLRVGRTRIRPRLEIRRASDDARGVYRADYTVSTLAAPEADAGDTSADAAATLRARRLARQLVELRQEARALARRAADPAVDPSTRTAARDRLGALRERIAALAAEMPARGGAANNANNPGLDAASPDAARGNNWRLIR